MKKKINWYAGSEHIKWMGPYKSQLEAWEAVKGLDGLPVPGFRVWCTADTYSFSSPKENKKAPLPKKLLDRLHR